MTQVARIVGVTLGGLAISFVMWVLWIAGLVHVAQWWEWI